MKIMKKKKGNTLVLYSTYLTPLCAATLPPVPPAPLGRPRPPRADRSRSEFPQGQRVTRVVYAAVHAAGAGKPPTPPP